MDRKMMNLGRAKKKLRYFQSEETSSCLMKIKDVLTMKDLDNIFDDLDSESESNTPQLSPLPKSDELVEQRKGAISPELNPSPHFEAEEPEVLATHNFIQKDHLNDKESPFKVMVPIKTSSPIDLLPAGDEAGDGERPETSPILFGVEDEEPIQGDLSKPLSSQRSVSPKKVLQESSESLVSPPARLEFGRPAKGDVVSVTSIPVRAPTAPAEECQTSAPETRDESEIDGAASQSPSVLVQENPSESLPKEKPKFQVPEVKLDLEVKESSFQKKLRNVFQPKRIQEPQIQERHKQQTRAPSPLELEDDFMILEDDAPVLFTIPRKADTSQKGKNAPEGASAKPGGNKMASEVKSASPKPREDDKKHKDERDAGKTKKTKAKQRKNVDETDTLPPAVVDERTETLTEAYEVGVCEQIPSVPEASQVADLPGKRKTKSKTSKSDRLGKKDGKNDNCAKIPAEKTASKIKKPAKLTSDACDGQEDTADNKKKKPNKVKSSINKALNSAKSNEQGHVNSAKMNKQMLEEQEQLDNLHNIFEPSLPSTEQPDVQSITVEAVKQRSTKQAASKRQANVKKAKKTKEDARMKVASIPDSNDSVEGPMTGKRKRKPPGEWWMNSDTQNESNMQEQEVSVQQPLQEIKPSKKIKTKEAPAASTQCSEEQETQNEPGQPKAVQKTAKKVKKSNTTGGKTNPKIAGGRRKPKSAPTQCQSKSPASVVDKEVTVHEVELSSTPCSSPPRRQSLTPGEKRVFDKIYSRDIRFGSAQKCPPSPLHQPENLHAKRQRKPTSNWWEVPQSQESVESSSPPNNSSLVKSKPQMPPPCSTLEKVANVVSSQKTVIAAQKKNKQNLIHTPKSGKGSLATLASGKAGSSVMKGLESRQKGRRNLLNSLEDQSEHSSENIHSDQQHGSSRATFDVCASDGNMDPFAVSKKTNARISAGSKRASDHDAAFKSGPSSMIDLEHFEHEDHDLPSSRIIPCVPRVLSDCELCGPPLLPIVLENEDWDNLCVWFAHLWPIASQDGQAFSAISPDDFHWHSHGGRAMGHMVDLQNNNFSNGKILLGSYMKKPPQVDQHAVTVFNVVSSCVRVQINGVMTVYNSGQTFMTPCGKTYSIHNICREPAVLWYHRMLPVLTRN